MKYVVAYDITNDKRRTKIADILSQYGIRVNFSVFEIELTQTQKENLLYEIEQKKLVHKEYDSLRFYHLCENCVAKSFDIANKADAFEEQNMVV